MKNLINIGFEPSYKEFIKKTGILIFCFIIKSEVLSYIRRGRNEHSIITDK